MIKTLSQLKDGDLFKFIKGQEALYIVNKTMWQSLETNDFTDYIVLQKNKVSVKCRPLYGSVEYIFKFSGVFSNYREGVDCEIIIEKENLKY